MENDLRRILLETASACASAQGCAVSTIARRCRNDSKFFSRIADTGQSFTVRTYDEVMDWFMKNWPDGKDRPVELLRWAAEYVRTSKQVQP
ncbi:hypothetical protein C7I85_26235 [Mesorhizobium soli]|uniref:Uncharacterized protein n=2 Tax=Pseudaminobacter soli (ex Li et al. 2025) TaxID=1295366 RepID=A0A2P7RZY6_9HYPH|nr:hypothetical protein C7I85_26235 [Mesorhizobium soli]